MLYLKGLNSYLMHNKGFWAEKISAPVYNLINVNEQLCADIPAVYVLAVISHS